MLAQGGKKQTLSQCSLHDDDCLSHLSGSRSVGDIHDLDSLLRFLEHCDAHSILGLQSTGAIPAERTEQLLLSLFQSQDCQVLTARSDILGKIGSRRVVKHLIRLLKRLTQCEQRVAIIRALTYLADKRSINTLIALAGDQRESWQVREAAVVALTEFNRKPQYRVYKALSTALKDPSVFVRAAVVEGLGRFCGSRFVALLQSALNDFEEVPGGERGSVAQLASESLERRRIASAADRLGLNR